MISLYTLPLLVDSPAVAVGAGDTAGDTGTGAAVGVGVAAGTGLLCGDTGGGAGLGVPLGPAAPGPYAYATGATVATGVVGGVRFSTGVGAVVGPLAPGTIPPLTVATGAALGGVPTGSVP